jgi:hypothetical protein
VKQLAAIPESLPELSSVRRSKRRAGEVDEFVGLTTERRKSIKIEGTKTKPDPTYYSYDSMIILNLHSIGVSLGQNSASVNLSVYNLKNMASSIKSDHGLVDRKSK